MSKMIQVRNVPDRVHRTLKARAAEAGMSLSDYIKRDLEASAERPSFGEIDAEVRARRRNSKLTAEEIVGYIREVRDA